MNEGLSLAIGLALSLLLIRWIYSGRRRNEGTEVSPVVLQQLMGMFPQIPEAVVRNEIQRSSSLQVAIERLLVISQQYPSVSETTMLAVSETRSNQGHQFESAVPLLADVPDVKWPVSIDADRFSKDGEFRSNLLQQRRQHMLQQAQKKFLKSKQSNGNRS